MDKSQLISTSLRQSPGAIAYVIGESLSNMFPGQAVVYGTQGLFDVERYAYAGLCELTAASDVYAHIDTIYQGDDDPIAGTIVNGWYDIKWQDHELQIIWAVIPSTFSSERGYWIVAESYELAHEFLAAVCKWNTPARNEIYVFDGGCWQKSAELYNSIQSSTFDRLILAEALKNEIIADFEQFFSAKEIYERYRLPWKRGIILIGPPGNGKTHTIKALINKLQVQCLYVKSLKSDRGSDHGNIRAVFNMARKNTPCILVLEDIDSLITDDNRSYFLNEMDGFMSNSGILVLATTNHPERLDPAILDRPSRFDRKYYFEVPSAPEREAYMSWWNGTVEAELQLSSDALTEIVAETDDFSFAYLKELWTSSMMRWINTGPGVGTHGRAMGSIMLAQVDILRTQMRAAEAAGHESPGSISEFLVEGNDEGED